jgi:predicted  nucleic acid-binding Zn-ribbon protein
MQSVEVSAKTTRSRRNPKKTKGNNEVTQIDETAARLNTHEFVCAERYKALETRMDSIESRMDSISQDVKELKDSTSKNMNEIKTMLQQAKDEKFKTIVTVAGTIIVALLGCMGYIVSHIK